jgi:hypothetical protein
LHTDFRDDIVLQVYDFEAAAVLIEKLDLFNLELAINKGKQRGKIRRVNRRRCVSARINYISTQSIARRII